MESWVHLFHISKVDASSEDACPAVARDAAVQASMHSSATVQRDERMGHSTQEVKPESSLPMYRAVPVRAVYMRPGQSMVQSSSTISSCL